jgi:glucose-1-phosphate adenylyltransferase
LKKVTAFVFAGVRTSGLSVLTSSRSVGAVPFAGKYRIIDFTLSNCTNSQVTDVHLLAQHKPRSLAKHVGRGEPWDLTRREGGIGIVQPYERQEGRRWFEGTADAIRQNLDVLDNSGCRHVLVLASELIYRMDYSWLMAAHRESGAEATLVVGPTQRPDDGHYAAFEMDKDLNILDVDVHPPTYAGKDVFLGLYLFDTSYLKDLVNRYPGPNLFIDCLQPELGKPTVKAYRYEGNWEGIVTLDDYLRANQKLLQPQPQPNLYDPEWRIYTRSEERGPAWVDAGANVVDSLICNGANIQGTVEHSIISPGVHIQAGSVVRNAVILNDATIETGCTVERTVLDKHVRIGAGSKLGSSNSEDPLVSVGEWGRVPANSILEPGKAVPPRKPELHEVLSVGIALP